MPTITIKLPDIGEGIAQAELVGWCVAVGDLVAEDAPLAEVMTDKATVEIPSAFTGRVIWLGAKVGETLAIGCDLVRIDVTDAAQTPCPWVNAAQETGFDDKQNPVAFWPLAEIRTTLTGLRRVIADKMQTSYQIPQYTVVEEVDVTSLLALRETLNARHPNSVHLTILPFVIRALVGALADYPEVNANLINDGKELVAFQGVQCGIATQTANGLMVPVLRDAQSLDLWQIAGAITQLAAACRAGRVERSDLSGSTITVSSLGAFGGLCTTPILNAPEVAVIGINRIATRPQWDGARFVPRDMVNLSCSFDHRAIDGWVAAGFVSKLKQLLEATGPA